MAQYWAGLWAQLFTQTVTIYRDYSYKKRARRAAKKNKQQRKNRLTIQGAGSVARPAGSSAVVREVEHPSSYIPLPDPGTEHYYSFCPGSGTCTSWYGPPTLWPPSPAPIMSPGITLEEAQAEARQRFDDWERQNR